MRQRAKIAVCLLALCGKDIELHYYASDDTLTLNDGGEVSWGVSYEVKGDTLRIGNAACTKAE